jgi:predicted negative regulator of RcsB-dependent stress response
MDNFKALLVAAFIIGSILLVHGWEYWEQSDGNTTNTSQG